MQVSVVWAATTAEPASPNDGEVYILPAGKSGAHWSAYANGALAYYRDGAWEEIPPREENVPVILMRLGRHAATQSSRIRLTAFS